MAGGRRVRRVITDSPVTTRQFIAEIRHGKIPYAPLYPPPQSKVQLGQGFKRNALKSYERPPIECTHRETLRALNARVFSLLFLPKLGACPRRHHGLESERITDML